MPQAKDCVVIGPNVRRRRQTVGDEAKIRLVHRHKVQPAVRVDVHGIEGLLIQRERERQTDVRVAIVTVIVGVGCPKHDRVRACGDYILGCTRRRREWCWGRSQCGIQHDVLVIHVRVITRRVAAKIIAVVGRDGVK